MQKILNWLFGFRSRVEIISNSNRQFGADPHYIRVRVTGHTGAPLTMLLTIEQYESAINRGVKNPEDN
jgi:hypothetical protein